MHICTYDYRTAEIVVIIFASNANKSKLYMPKMREMLSC